MSSYWCKFSLHPCWYAYWRVWPTWFAGLADEREEVFGGVESLLYGQPLEDGDQLRVRQSDTNKHSLVPVTQQPSDGHALLSATPQATPQLNLQCTSHESHVTGM